MPSYDNLNLNLCETLYAQGAGAHAAPHYTYRHADKVIAGEACPSGTSSVAGLAFYTGSRFPARYRDGLFFADYSRSCLWFMPVGANGLPDPAQRESFGSGIVGIVNLVQGPDGSLYYPDLNNGAVRRISYGAPNDGPTARATATPASGGVPLAVQFDGTGSTDPERRHARLRLGPRRRRRLRRRHRRAPDPDLHAPGVVTVGLRVTDSGGLQGTTTVTVTAGAPPSRRSRRRRRARPGRSATRSRFSGSARDWQDAALPASRLAWKLLLQHCGAGGEDCHTHTVQTWSGVASGTFVAPDHEYPSYLELELTATDASGLTSTVRRRLDPKTVALTFETAPAGLQLSVGSFSGAAPFTRTVIQGSTQGLSAPGPQTLGGRTYAFTGWSDGGAASHAITAPAAPATYRATFAEQGGGPAGLVGAWGFDEASGAQATDASGRGNHGTISGATRAAGRPLRRRPELRRHERLGDGRRRRVARPHDRDDARGVGQPGRARDAWRTALLKEHGGTLAYALYAHNGAAGPAGHVNPAATRASPRRRRSRSTRGATSR